MNLERFSLYREPNLHRKGREISLKDKDLNRGIITILDPSGPVSEAYRTLRTNLLYAFVDDPPQVIILTSCAPGEGKSTTCANLSIVLMQMAKSVLVIDCDLRRPTVHKFFGIPNIRGLTDVLLANSTLEEVWQEPVGRVLKVLPAGAIPPNPTEILGSQRFSEFLAQVREKFDYVLIDAPPIIPVSDPAILASHGDGVLLVIDAQNTRKGTVRQAMRSLKAVGANVLGTVMNNVDVSKGGYYYENPYHYGSTYER